MITHSTFLYTLLAQKCGGDVNRFHHSNLSNGAYVQIFLLWAWPSGQALCWASTVWGILGQDYVWRKDMLGRSYVWTNVILEEALFLWSILSSDPVGGPNFSPVLVVRNESPWILWGLRLRISIFARFSCFVLTVPYHIVCIGLRRRHWCVLKSILCTMV